MTENPCQDKFLSLLERASIRDGKQTSLPSCSPNRVKQFLDADVARAYFHT